jgi:hypothetical protein
MCWHVLLTVRDGDGGLEKYLEPIPITQRYDMMSAYHRILTGTDETAKLGMRCSIHSLVFVLVGWLIGWLVADYMVVDSCCQGLDHLGNVDQSVVLRYRLCRSW